MIFRQTDWNDQIQSPTKIAGLHKIATSLWHHSVASAQRVQEFGYRRQGSPVLNAADRHGDRFGMSAERARAEISRIHRWFREVNAIAGLFLASLAIRSCLVDTLSGFKAPSVFLKNSSVHTVLRFPRLGPPERRSPTSSALSEHYDFRSLPRNRLLIRRPAPASRL